MPAQADHEKRDDRKIDTCKRTNSKPAKYLVKNNRSRLIGLAMNRSIDPPDRKSGKIVPTEMIAKIVEAQLSHQLIMIMLKSHL